VTSDLTLVHLYPDLLRTYGDRGNVLALQRRAEWRGFTVSVVPVTRGEPIPLEANIVLMGGGTDRVQEMIASDLLLRRPELEDLAARETVLLGVCGGYQFLGRSYVAADGTAMEGLGLLDATTEAPEDDRIIGRVVAEASLWGKSFELVGFENHGGRTVLGARATPLASVVRGSGNNGTDGQEGAVQGTVVGTYLHGPVLPANPRFADAVLTRALAHVLDGAVLRPLDDPLEEAAHRTAVALAK
jgi:lipid II isoglutaminyl synthase (glutamine-hydrolysing)